jgi:hypothetical protein
MNPVTMIMGITHTRKGIHELETATILPWKVCVTGVQEDKRKKKETMTTIGTRKKITFKIADKKQIYPVQRRRGKADLL